MGVLLVVLAFGRHLTAQGTIPMLLHLPSGAHWDCDGVITLSGSAEMICHVWICFEGKTQLVEVPWSGVYPGTDPWQWEFR